MKTFDPKKLTVTLGTHTVTGFASDSMLAIELDSEVYNTDVDAYGNSSRFKINNTNATLTLTLSQASPSNDMLATFYALDVSANQGAFPVMIKDNSGTTLITSQFGYIEKLPSIEYGAESKNREWVIKLTETTFTVGGIT